MLIALGLAGAWMTLDPLQWLHPASTDTRVSVSDYVCPMHRHLHSDLPGHCPICGMDLVPADSLQVTKTHQGSFETVHLSATRRNLLSVRTARVVRGDLPRSIDALGKITRIDPTARRVVTPPVAGKLVYLAEKYQGDEITPGELLFSVFSDALGQVQSDYQRAFAAGRTDAAGAMIPGLRRAGLTEKAIAALQTGAAPNFPASVYASEPGVVFARRGQVGARVSSGFTVFNLGGDYQVAEVTAEIFERQWSQIAKGQPATMELRGMPGTVFHGEVTRVEPPVGYTTRSLEIKLKFKTRDRNLAQSTFAHVRIQANTRHKLLLAPSDAVIRTGEGERVVVVDDEGGFRPVTVETGEESQGFTEVLSGLHEHDMVVVSGQFLIDSESNILAGLRRLSSDSVDPVEAEQGTPLVQGKLHGQSESSAGQSTGHGEENDAGKLRDES